MKLSKFVSLVVIGLVLTVAASGCKKKPGYITPLPPGMTQNPKDLPPGGAMGGETASPSKVGSEGIPTNPADLHAGWLEDRDTLKADIVHFDFDSSAVKASEKPKVAAVADYLKANAAKAVKIEGHCDERGTEEYNRALGERRALALREELVSLGIESTRVDTISYGEDKPIALGHDEAAWRQNRRGEFIVLTKP